MRMGLRAACCISRLFSGVRTAFGFCNIAISALVERMSMAWHLRHAQGRAADSAGNTVRVGLRAASITGVCCGSILPEHGGAACISAVAA